MGKAKSVEQKSVYVIPLESGGPQFAYSLCQEHVFRRNGGVPFI